MTAEPPTAGAEFFRGVKLIRNGEADFLRLVKAARAMRKRFYIESAHVGIRRGHGTCRSATGQKAIGVGANFDRFAVVERAAAALVAPLEIAGQLDVEIRREAVLDERAQNAAIDFVFPRTHARVGVERID